MKVVDGLPPGCTDNQTYAIAPSDCPDKCNKYGNRHALCMWQINLGAVYIS